jgi:hypothetical protein
MDRVVLHTLVGAVVAATLFAGCGYRERICSKGEYPAVARDNTTGRVCVVNGEQPPKRCKKYPRGKTPTFLDEDYYPTRKDYGRR